MLKLNCPNEQVNPLSQLLINIFSNFIPNKIVKVKPQQAPWITKAIKIFLRKRNRAYKSFAKSDYSQERSEMIQQMTLQGTRLVEGAKQRYFLNIGQKLSRPDTGNKMYWSLINRVNKAKIPLIPPLLENGKFVLDLESKAQILNDYFILQCTTLDTGSGIPNATPLYVPVLTGLQIPLKIVYENCIVKGVFQQIWKQANAVPVRKKDSKYLKQNYHLISLLPVFGEIFHKLIYAHLYKHLCVNKLHSPSQSGFHPNDSTTNQLLSIVHMVFSSFDCSPPMDARSVYLDISKAFVLS